MEGSGPLLPGFRQRARAAAQIDRNSSFKCDLGLTPFGPSYAVARPYSFGTLRSAVVGYEELRYRLDVEDIGFGSFVVRCPLLGHAVVNITVIDATVAGMKTHFRRPWKSVNAECDDIHSFCIVHMPEVPDSVQMKWENVSLDVACTPVSFLASSLLSAISRERDRWLWWWPLKEGDISTRASHIEYLS
jgi:hypothetical protein